MNKSNLYRAITVAGKLAQACDSEAVPSQVLLEESLAVILDLVSKLKEYENANQAQKMPGNYSISTTRDSAAYDRAAINTTITSKAL